MSAASTSSAAPFDPLDHARASFTGHTANHAPLGGRVSSGSNGTVPTAQEVDPSSSQWKQVDGEMEPAEAAADGDETAFEDWRTQVNRLSSSPPKINPFHLLSHPSNDDEDTLPPLPPHLEKLASGADDTSSASTSTTTTTTTPNPSTPAIHIAKVTKNAVQVVHGPIEDVQLVAADVTRPTRIIKKVTNVFRRDPAATSTANGMADMAAMTGMSRIVGGVGANGASPIMMQGAPPSPPISEVDVGSEDGRWSAAVTDSTEPPVGDDATGEWPTNPTVTTNAVPDAQGSIGLSPVNETAESALARANSTHPSDAALDASSLFTQSLTAEPAELASSPPPAGLAASPSLTTRANPAQAPGMTPSSSYLSVNGPAPRRVSSGSASGRAGSLTVVRSGRLAPQRDRDATPSSAGPSGSAPGSFSGSLSSPALEGQAVDPRSLSPLDTSLGMAFSKELPRLPTDDRVRQASVTSLSPSPETTGMSPSGSGSGFSRSASGPGAPRIHRRSTNPTSPTATFVPRSPLVHSHSTFASPSPSRTSPLPQTEVPGLDGSALDSYIVAATETIRRERLERRAKKMNQGMSPTTAEGRTGERREFVPPRRKDTEDEKKVLVGNLIGEDHVNYVLMYNMLTGIRIGVSRCQAKIKRPLTDEDFVARHKFSFDIIGNELTPSARYDFKFKDYAPWVFRELRDEHFHLDPADYLLSLTAKYILSELGSPGKSGSFFYFSRDYRFIIKTISHSEHKFLRSILKDYVEHVRSNPHTLLSRFYGLHRVKLPRGRKIHFVIMNNLFPPHRDIHETYDLKGSAWGREYPEEKAAKNPRAVLKDKNWVNRGRTLEFGPEKRALLSEQLRRDMEFLKRMKVMDYSLLVGIHNMERGNRDNLRENRLHMVDPDVHIRRKPSSVKGHHEAHNVRNAVRRSDPKMLDVALDLPAEDSADRRHFLFYQDEGGLRATDEQNNNLDMIYYLGVIDICTPYNTAKRIEHLWKSMTENANTISCVDPIAYGHRFLNFLLSVMRNGDPSLRPQGLLPEPEKTEDKPVGQVTGEAEKRDEVVRAAAGEGNEEGKEAAAAVVAAGGGTGTMNGDDERAIVGHLKAE